MGFRSNTWKLGFEEEEEEVEKDEFIPMEENLSKSILEEKQPPILKDFLYPPFRFSQVPSRNSIYTEFMPPDLTKFQTDKKYENIQPFFMTTAWRVVSFFMVVFVLPTLMISIPLYARYHMYYARVMSFTDGDMISLHDLSSTFWCQGQRLIGNGSFESYLTENVRRRKVKRSSKLTSQIYLTSDDIEEWGFFLIKGSYFKFSACSRWPGGTLLVVKGEEQLRRCFYVEERTKEEIGDQDHRLKAILKEMTNRERIRNEGGENFEDEAEILSTRISKEKNNNQPNSNLTSKLKYNQTSTSNTLSNPLALNIEGKNLGMNEINQNLVKINNGNIKRKKSFQRKSKTLSNGNRNGNQRNNFKGRLRKRAINSSPYFKISSNPINIEHMLIDGSLFFDINDTLDVTAGNSSFSSSEEFLQQCSDTIYSIDLMPFPDCSRKADAEQPDLTWQVRINQSDHYYFIFTSDNSIEANVISFNLLLDRKLYDVSRNLSECSNSTECVFPFTFLKSQGVIVDFNERESTNTLQDLTNYELTVICQPRSAVYTIFILLVPFIIIMFAFR